MAISLIVRFLLIAVGLSAFTALAVERPRSPEQYLIDNSLWPAGASNTVAYQPKYEFPFYDSRVDTCPDSWPYDPILIGAGMSGCYDLAPPNWADVSCSGSSGQHPTLSNVYIIRQSDYTTAFATADNSQYRWVLQCPGFSVLGKASGSTPDRTIDAAGVGLGAGQLRIYDCLNSDGSYTPMTPGVVRTDTANECHIEQVYIQAAYVWVRSKYFEAISDEFTQAACRMNVSDNSADFMSGCDNFDMYLGGQTQSGTGYNTTWQAFGGKGTGAWFQNGRIVDCVARRWVDGDGTTMLGNQARYQRIVNVEMINCPRMFTGSSNPPENKFSEGNVHENVWLDNSNGARNFGDTNASTSPQVSTVDWDYWDRQYPTQGDKIAYGRVAGEPPSYAKAAAASDAEVDDAFNCGNPKTVDACPWTCTETLEIGYKNGANAGNDEQLARRAFVYGTRANRIDDNNPVMDYRDGGGSGTSARMPSCGGSAGTETGVQPLGGQFNLYNVRHDLIVSETPMSTAIAAVTGSGDNEAFGVTLTNSLIVHQFFAHNDNAYTDEWPVTFFYETVQEDVASEPTYFHAWGNTYAMVDYVGESARPDRYWTRNNQARDYTDDCSVFIDAENDDTGNNNWAINRVGLFGASAPPTGATDKYPAAGTYPTSELGPFCHIERPWTAIANNVAPTIKCYANVVPPESSPLEAQCDEATP